MYEHRVAQDECRNMLNAAHHKVTYELAHVAKVFEDLCQVGLEPEFTKLEGEVLHEFLQACALYEGSPEIRRASWGTIGAWELLKALGITIDKLNQIENPGEQKRE